VYDVVSHNRLNECGIVFVTCNGRCEAHRACVVGNSRAKSQQIQKFKNARAHTPRENWCMNVAGAFCSQPSVLCSALVDGQKIRSACLESFISWICYCDCLESSSAYNDNRLAKDDGNKESGARQ
jgi:hypothetical protein